MHRLLTFSFVLLCSAADAGKLHVQLMVTPGVMVRQAQCPDRSGANPSAALTGTNTYSYAPISEKQYPGTVMVSVNGGVPPYRYDWHGLMADASVCSVLPGMVRVTVTDAEGSSVTRSAHVGSRSRTLPSPCGNTPLTEQNGNLTTTRVRSRDGSSGGSRRTMGTRGVAVQDHRNDLQRVPRGPAGGGRPRFTPVAVPADKVRR